jgi:SAM-dependent methyltransferase
MPTSHSSVLHPLVRVLTKIRPESILDVGIGFGKLGFLAREYLDVRAAKHDLNLYRRENWKTRVEGIEIFPEYVGELQKLLYNQVHIGDVFEILPKLGRFDFVWIGDVIEHIEKDRGLKLIGELIEKSDRVFGLCTPYGDTEQEGVFDNPSERHLSGWTEKDFDAWPNGEVYRLDGRKLLFLISKDPMRWPIRGIGRAKVEIWRRKKLVSYWRER